MKVTIKDTQGNAQGEREVRFPVIENQRGSQAAHQTVVAYLAAQRSGTASTKTMGEVAGSGKKPWRQKGTGRARAGSFASPLWRGGGVVFGPKPRDFRPKLPQAVRRLALQKALSERLRQSDVVVLQELAVASHKTKEFLKVLDALQVEGTVLVVVTQPEPKLRLATRNIPGLAVTTAADLNAYQTLRYDKLVFTQEAFAQVEERLLKA